MSTPNPVVTQSGPTTDIVDLIKEVDAMTELLVADGQESDATLVPYAKDYIIDLLKQRDPDVNEKLARNAAPGELHRFLTDAGNEDPLGDLISNLDSLKPYTPQQKGDQALAKLQALKKAGSFGKQISGLRNDIQAGEDRSLAIQRDQLALNNRAGAASMINNANQSGVAGNQAELSALGVQPDTTLTATDGQVQVQSLQGAIGKNAASRGRTANLVLQEERRNQAIREQRIAQLEAADKNVKTTAKYLEALVGNVLKTPRDTDEEQNGRD